MKKIIMFCLMLECCSSWSSIYAEDLNDSLWDSYPDVSLDFRNQLPSSVFYGETLRIPLHMGFKNLWIDKIWHTPLGSNLENAAGTCPNLIGDRATYWHGICTLNLVIQGNQLGKVIAGKVRYTVSGQNGRWPHKHSWQRYYYSPYFSITVIPHPLSMSAIPIQNATANQAFRFELKKSINYYEENVFAKTPPEGKIAPEELMRLNELGLHFDLTNLSITGIPIRIGTFSFNVGVKNTNGCAEPTQILINVGINPKDKPVFKNEYNITSASPNQKYTLNLMELLEPSEKLLENNQITFRLKPDQRNPEWLHISTNDPTLLEGIVPKDTAGQEVEVRLIASSNTGGDSNAIVVKIPVAYDPNQKPIISFFEMEQLAGNQFYTDTASYIKDPAHDPNLKVILDKVEPIAPWLHVSSLNPTVIEGAAPIQATGQKYQITLRANTSLGGNSEAITIPLQISIDKSKTPGFKAANPILPLVYPGQSFFYDFVANRDVYPEYDNAPYLIQFAKEYEHPNWLRLEDNKLIAEKIPEEIDSNIDLYLVIKNLPGGSSNAIPLSLIVMN